MNKQIKKDIYEFLNNLPSCRTSDKYLVKLYCDFKGLSTDFADANGITIGEINTITRSRRKHQEENPDLYPKGIRRIREEERKEFKKEFKRNV